MFQKLLPTIQNYTELLYWLSRFGIPKKKISADEIILNPSIIKAPIFFLSTGRCGTQWFAKTLHGTKGTAVFHFPQPDMALYNCYAYEKFAQYQLNYPDETIRALSNLFLAGREQYFRHAYKSEKRYIETNNHITFFAPIIAKLIPQAKFVHVYRHPGEFVRSGIRREWYQAKGLPNRQIVPVTSPYQNVWENFSHVQKIAWLWNETNQFIEQFKKSIADDQSYTFNFNELDENSLQGLISFLDLKTNISKLGKRIHVKDNQQSSNSYLDYEEWDATQKHELRNICLPLAKTYGYQL